MFSRYRSYIMEKLDIYQHCWGSNFKMNSVSVFFFVLFGVLGIITLLVHGIEVHRFGNYLKTNHPTKWKELIPEKFLWLKRGDTEIRNYFSEIRFVFNSELITDSKVYAYKIKIRRFLILGILSLLCAIFSFFIT